MTRNEWVNEWLNELEKKLGYRPTVEQVYRAAVEHWSGNKSQAARALSITRNRLRYVLGEN